MRKSTVSVASVVVRSKFQSKTRMKFQSSHGYLNPYPVLRFDVWGHSSCKYGGWSHMNELASFTATACLTKELSEVS